MGPILIGLTLALMIVVFCIVPFAIKYCITTIPEPSLSESQPLIVSV
jgi:hypothetical protein